MKALVLAAVVALAAVGANPAPAAGETFQAKCELYDAAVDQLVESACRQETGEDGQGRYTETYTVGGRRFVVVFEQLGAPFSRVTINGRPAVRFEHHRSWYSFGTLDLKLTLDVKD